MDLSLNSPMKTWLYGLVPLPSIYMERLQKNAYATQGLFIFIPYSNYLSVFELLWNSNASDAILFLYSYAQIVDVIKRRATVICARSALGARRRDRGSWPRWLRTARACAVAMFIYLFPDLCKRAASQNHLQSCDVIMEAGIILWAVFRDIIPNYFLLLVKY
jgi:hypothetical protein